MTKKYSNRNKKLEEAGKTLNYRTAMPDVRAGLDKSRAVEWAKWKEFFAARPISGSDIKELLDEGADLSTKLGRSEQRNKTLRAELADRERVIARLESRGPPVDDGEERARLEGEAASLEARAASLELENGSLKRLAAASAETRDKLSKPERLLAAALTERDASRADAAAARRDAC